MNNQINAFFSSLIICIYFSLASVKAQLIIDSSLGIEESIITSQELIDLIEGGAIRNNHLFHSFLEFNVNSGQQVYFANPTGIINIFTRVTGTNPSNINGTLGVDGGANLFLLNPNGINFGADAFLDISGSFFATTADSFMFEDGWEFSATKPEAPPLLTINIPMGLQYGSAPGNINVSQSTIAVKEGQNLSLMGGNIQVNGGQINAPGGMIELGAITGAGYIGINPDGGFSFPEGIARGDVSLTDGAIASVVSGGGGGINVNARNLMITGGSSLRAGIIKEGLPTRDFQAGDININATESVTLANEENPSEEKRSFIQSFVFENTVGNAGNININTDELFLFVANIQAQIETNSEGNGGNITINANNIDLNGGTIQTQLRQSSQGTAGNININTNYLSLREVRNEQRSKVQASVADNAIGDGGDIVINTNYLLLDRGTIDASIGNNSEGNAGNILIDAGKNGSIEITGEGINSTIDTSLGQNSQGSTGDIKIVTGLLSLYGSGFNLSGEITLAEISSKLAQGAITTNQNGDITILADTINLTGQAFIESSLLEGAMGNAGSINITTNTLTLDGANTSIRSTINQPSIPEKQVSNPNTGTAGNLRIDAQTITMRDGANFRLSVLSDSPGTPGNVTIFTDSLELIDGSYISTDGDGTGNAGKIEVNATNYLRLSGVISNREIIGFDSNQQVEALLPPSRFESRSLDANDGAGGEIIINTPSLQVLDGALMITNTGSNIDAGSITVNGQILELKNGGQILSLTSGEGNAGNIEFNLSESIIIEGIDANRGIIIQELINNIQARIESGKLPADTNPELVANEAFTKFFTISENSGIFASTTEDSTGAGGNITIHSESVLIQDSGQINVSSLGMGEGGEIEIFADNMNLNNGQIIAETNNSDGGNISLQIAKLLQLQNESLISATANHQANGGNVNIDTGFMIALPATGTNGSDISANAQFGNGGLVIINTEGLFGMEFQSFPTPVNDITASSEFGATGIVTINQPNVDPAQSITALPIDVTDATNLIYRSCPTGGGEEELGRFVVTGRVGLASQPSEPLNSEEVLVGWIVIPKLEPETEMVQIEDTLPSPIIEAQGWIIGANGKVILTAEPNSYNSVPTSYQCLG